uniref:Chaperone DnaJ C-terminal domain-containing protein n=1 Tax=Molossus molossus TaxID=27622 RepID=A0A7J8I0A7_MOLMO|nr:hypothetical protein HJG59_010889 [Molossus molossus]
MQGRQGDPGEDNHQGARRESVFQRRGHDLIMKMIIQLSEALCGFKKTINTLDDRVLVMTSESGEVTKHGDLKCVYNEGMPIYKAPLEKGSLVIQFLVIFPETQGLPLDKLPRLEALPLLGGK